MPPELKRILAAVDLGSRLVCSHTLPAHNASTRVLEKLGMRFVGYADDPDEGTVWRWELKRTEVARWMPNE